MNTDINNHAEYSFDSSLQKLDATVSGDQKFMNELAQGFLSELSGTEQEITQHLEAQDWVNLKRVFHSIKPNALLFGSESLSELCLKLEHISLAEDQAALESCLGYFFSHLEQFRQDLKAAVK